MRSSSFFLALLLSASFLGFAAPRRNTYSNGCFVDWRNRRLHDFEEKRVLHSKEVDQIQKFLTNLGKRTGEVTPPFYFCSKNSGRTQMIIDL